MVQLSYSYDTLDNLLVFFSLEIFSSWFENDVYNFIIIIILLTFFGAVL